MEKLLKISVNIHLSDKSSDKKWFGRGFVPYNITLDELAEVVQRGFAFSYQFSDGIRKSLNFLCTDIIAIDIDDGLTITEAKDNDIVKKYCSLLYTTPSHSIDRQRFRLVFVLPRTISDVKELVAATISLARRLGGDMAATDGARMFFGSENCHYELLDHEISTEFLDELIADGMVQPVSDTISDASKTAASRSVQSLDADMVFKTSNGDLIQLKDFTKTTPVYCNFHKDENASGFVSMNEKGSTYFHCMSCQLTRWMKSVDLLTYDFNDFENTVRAIKNNQKIVIRKPVAMAEGTLESFFNEDPVVHYSADNISIQNEQHFKLQSIEQGLIFIKSPKGTGKTTFLAKGVKLLTQAQGGLSFKDFEDNSHDDIPLPLFTNVKVLLIGHRQALIRDLCKRLGLDCYLDATSKSRSDSVSAMKRYGICLDSLFKIKDQKYDIVIIDEVEQVLAHFLSSTIGSNREKIFEIFARLINNAKSVVALDADLGWTSVLTLTRLANSNNNLVGASVPVKIIINDWVPPKKNIHIYSSKDQLQLHMLKSVMDGRRVFVSSNSKTRISNLERSFQELAEETGKPINVIAITSENSSNKDIQDFILNIKTRILDYHVILSSPSLGTGVDITFDNGRSEIDCVYGIFENLINTHTDIDQQLSRVRHPKEVHIWVSALRFNFETEFDVVKQDCLKHSLVALTHAGDRYEPFNDAIARYAKFLTMAAMITSFQRASKNNLKSNFLDYKASHGWNIIHVPINDEYAAAGKAFYQIGVDLKSKEDMQAVLNASPMTQADYEDFEERSSSNEHSVSRQERLSFYRTKIELFYRLPISMELITLDEKAAYRKKLRTFEALTVGYEKTDLDGTKHKTSISDIKSKKRKFDINSSVVLSEKMLPDYESRYLLLHNLLSTTPVFQHDVFFEDTLLCSNDLSELVQQCTKLKPFIENHLEMNIRKDIDQKPMQQLHKLLDLAGLSLWKAGSSSTTGIKVRYYRLDKDKLRNLQKRVNHRKKNKNEWLWYNTLHGFSNELTEAQIKRRQTKQELYGY